LEVSAVSSRTPSYRCHKPTNQAVTTIDGRDYYLGAYDSPKSRAEYDRLIAEWLTNGRRLSESVTGGLSINEMLVAYLDFAAGYYRKGGKPTRELDNLKDALRPLKKLYGLSRADHFGPLALKTVRDAMIKSGLCRNEINKRVGKIVRVFRWATENEHLPASVHQALSAVSGLKKGRTEVRESEPVKPVPQALVEAVRPHVSRQVWAMIELQLLTGMRPGEVCQMRSGDLDTSGKVWVYVPRSHKTEHHDRDRPIPLGPRAQEVLRP
jgi:integrase